MTDHGVSEAIYLAAPDGQGSRSRQPSALGLGGACRLGDDIAATRHARSAGRAQADPENEPFEHLAAGTAMGHVHLKVASIAATVGFYRDVLGFGLMIVLGAQAAFLSAGGYHHHIGVNTWESASGSPPPVGAAALRHATIVLPDGAALEALRARLTAHGVALIDQRETSVLDPSGIRLRFELARVGV